MARNPRIALDLAEHPHRRLNPLTGEWIFVSPHRARRPWQGKIEDAAQSRRPSYDPKCYLCPGNARAGSEKNPSYQSTFVFDNDFSALLERTPVQSYRKSDLLVAEGEPGLCRVVCFSPRHDLTLAEMSAAEIRSGCECLGERIPDAREQAGGPACSDP